MFTNERCDIICGVTAKGEYITDDRFEYHVGVFGTTGAGKTETTFYPTLVRGWRRSAIVYVRKVSLLEKTITERQKFSHCLVMDWRNPQSVRYNFLDAIPNSRQAVGAVQTLMSILFRIDDGEFFDLSAYKLAIAGTLHVLYAHNVKNMGAVRRFLAKGDAALTEMIEMAAHPLAVQEATELMSAGGLSEKAAGQRQAIYSSIGVRLQMFDDPIVDEVTASSDFSMADLMCADNPVTLYLVLRKRDTKRLRPLARLFLDQMQGELMDEIDFVVENGDRRPKKHPLLIALDEVDKLGKLEELASAAGDMREPGLRLMVGTQGISLIEELYGEKGSMMINLRGKVFFRPDHPHEVDRITYWVGKAEEDEMRETFSGRILSLLGFNVAHGPQNRSQTTVKVRKDVFPQEAVMAMDDNDIIVALGNLRIRGKRMISSIHPKWAKLLKVTPISSMTLRNESDVYTDAPRPAPFVSHWDGIMVNNGNALDDEDVPEWAEPGASSAYDTAITNTNVRVL